MTDYLGELIKGKRVLILGFGKEGQSTYRQIRKFFPDQDLIIGDKNPELCEIYQELANDSHLILRLGNEYCADALSVGWIIKSPGIPFSELPETIDREIVQSQADIFIRSFRNQIIGITGTKGKSTTSSLIYHILKGVTSNVLLVGNIGLPPFEMLDEINSETIIVNELSSHQLERLRVSPKYAILLNVFREHLDHYDSYEAYQEAKFNIVRYQQPEDYFIYFNENPIINKLINLHSVKSLKFPYSDTKTIGISCYQEEGFIIWQQGKARQAVYELSGKRSLAGVHNVLNLMAAISYCKIAGISDEKIEEGIGSFSALPHRLEYIGKINEIDFYNDSIATIPEAALAAIHAISGVNTIILGGKDRGLDYSDLLNYLSSSTIENLIFMGECGNRMQDEYRNIADKNQKIFLAKDFAEVVRLGITKTATGKVCLLSPAAASYDWFYNFEERGNEFKRLLRAFPEI